MNIEKKTLTKEWKYIIKTKGEGEKELVKGEENPTKMTTVTFIMLSSNGKAVAT